VGKKICLVHYRSAPGGIEVLLPGIIKGLQSQKFNVFVIRPPSAVSPSVYSGMNVDISYGSGNNIVAAFKLARHALRRKNETFHVFNIGPLFLLVLRLCSIKRIIYSIHGTIYWHNNFEKLSRKLLWWIAVDKKKQIFTCNSEYSGQVFRKNIASGIKCELLYNFFDMNRFKQIVPSEFPGEIRKVVYVGRLVPGKGLARWISIALDIHSEFQDVKFEIYGDGPLTPSIQREIDLNFANAFIILKGHVTDVENVFRSADLLLFLSEYESFGNVVVESILCNTPVLASNIPGMNEIFADFPDFLLKNDPPSSREIISKLKNFSKLRELTEVAGGSFRKRFSIERHLEKLTNIYEAI
jgi:glycosyltransferase involved in cell wall biosynthesis